MATEPTYAWYCVRSRPKHEHIAAAHLRQLEQVEVFCPKLRLKRMTKRGPVWFVEALFPGYLFARFERMASQRRVASAQGVSTIVRFREELAKVSDEVICVLRQAMGDDECRVIDESIQAGDRVIVAHGLFRGLSSIVTQVMPARDRVRVLLEFLGQSREVELAKTEVLPDRPHILAI